MPTDHHLSFHQTQATFYVEEVLSYSLAGEGAFRFALIRKQNQSTQAVKRRISEETGVPLRHIHHAGKKDAAATATQWLSWPEAMARREPRGQSGAEILALDRHTNALQIGHIKANRFRMILDGHEGELPEHLREPASFFFPNFFGGQRFGQGEPDKAQIKSGLAEPMRDRDRISVFQAALFNAYLRDRWTTRGMDPGAAEFWTQSNGKRVFWAETDEDLMTRFAGGEVLPTGPVYGYKVKLSQDEIAFLQVRDLAQESFRPWGKIARGARRPLFCRADGLKVTENIARKQLVLDFNLPSGSYATVFLTFLFQPALFSQAKFAWPNFTHRISLGDPA